MPRIIKQIIVHHTADASLQPQLKTVDSHHKKEGYPKSSLGFFVGYHYLIESDGALVQTRKDDEIGAHDAGENEESIGIAFAGNFNEQYPLYAQVLAFRALAISLIGKYNIELEDVVPHRKDDKTDCYGTKLSDVWAQKQVLVGLAISHVEQLINFEKLK